MLNQLNYIMGTNMKVYAFTMAFFMSLFGFAMIAGLSLVTTI